MSEVYTGQVLGISKWAAGTPNTITAFCRALLGGTFTLDPHNIQDIGATGQVVTRKGTLEATLNVSVLGPAKTDTALWFPTTAGVQVAAFPNFLVEVDDGAGGKEYRLTAGQPGTVTVSCGDAPDARVQYDFMMKFATVAQAAIGTDAAVYNSVVGHTINDTTVQIATADEGVLSWSLSNDLGLEMQNPQDTKTPGVLTLPEGYYFTTQAPTFACVTSNAYMFDDAAVVADTWATPYAITAALANGTAGENVTFTLSNFVPGVLNVPLESAGRVGFGHEFTMGSGNIYNRVVIT